MKRKISIEDDRKTVYLFCRDKIGLSQRRLAMALSVAQSTAQGWKDFCCEEDDASDRQPRPRGRPRILGPEHLDFLEAEIHACRNISLERLKEALVRKFDISVTEMTISRQLSALGYEYSPPPVEPLAIPATKEKRVAFARKWIASSFENVIFSDEVSIQLFRNKVWIWRRSDELLHGFSLPSRQPRLTAWGGISRRGRTLSMVTEHTVDSSEYCSILSKCLVGKSPFTDRPWLLQQDNAPAHTARATKAFLMKKKITTIDWPASSPDLNPIERLWKWVKDEIEKARPTNLKQVAAEYRKAWTRITVGMCNNYIDKIYSVMEAILKNEGSFTFK
jgi:transposase